MGRKKKEVLETIPKLIPNKEGEIYPSFDKVEKEDRKTYRVGDIPIRHKGVVYTESIELTDEEALELKKYLKGE